MESVAEKIKRHQQIVMDYLSEKAAVKIANLPGCEHMVVADTERHHYQLLTTGWTPNQYVHSLMMHLDIASDGKVWLKANWTDTDIAEALVQRGIAKGDIVLGFYPELLREQSEYAVA